MNSRVKKIFKIVLRVIAGIIIFVILLLLSLNLPFVQNFVKNKIITYLKKKTNTEISLERIRIGFPKDLELNKFYIADKKKDTLLYVDRLAVDLDMIALFSNKIELNSIELNKVRANIHRLNPDTAFNYQFLIDSLMSDQTKTPKEEKNDTTSTLKFDLDKIVFNDIQIKFKDDVSGSDAGVFLGKLDAKVNKFDLSNMHYVLNKLHISNSNLHYYLSKPLTVLQQTIDKNIDSTANKNSGQLPLLEFKDFKFDNVNLSYDDQLSDTKATLALNAFHLENLLLDITNGKYQSTNTLLQNSLINFAYRPTPSNEKAVKAVADSTKDSPFSLYLNNLLLANNNIRYDNLAAKRQNGRFDYNHINIKKLNLSAKKFTLDSTGISADVSGGQLADTSGFVLNELKGNFIYDQKQIKLDNFLLKTPNTYLENNSQLNYTSTDDLSKHPERVAMNINFNNSLIGMQDLYYFVPSVPANYKNQKIKVATNISGYMNNLAINKFQLSGLRNTNIDIDGGIKGLPKMDQSIFNINIRKLNTSKADLLALVPTSSLPSSIELPNYIVANGHFNGSTSNFNTLLNIKTDMGGANIIAAMGGPKNREIYRAKIQLSNFNVGKLIKQQDQIGTVSMLANINGRGLSPKNMNAKLNGTIYHAYYNKYDYKNIKLDGSYAGNTITVNANSTDSNANFVLNTIVDMKGKSPAVKGTVDLKKIDLQKLNFYKDELKLAGLVNLDFSSVDPDYLNGTAILKSLQIATNGQTYNLDTLMLAASSTATANHLQLTSDVITAEFDGKYQLTQIGQAFINQVNKYYAFGQTKNIAPQRMQFVINIINPSLIRQFVPSLIAMDPASISGIINTNGDTLLINGNFPHVIYDSFTIKNITLGVTNKDTAALRYALNIKSVESPSIQLYNSEISGAAANNLLGVNVFLRDSKNKDKYLIGGNFKAQDQTYTFSLDPQKLLLNYDKWIVAQDNMIQYGKAGVYVRHFDISNSGQALSVNSTSTMPNAPVNIKFTNFMLETLTRYAEQDTAMVGGLLNGTVDVKNLEASPQFEANLTVNKLRYQKDQLGDLKIQSDNYTKDAYRINVALSGLHDIRATGYYYTSNKGALDMVLDINKIDLKYIESVTGGQIKDGSGIITGQLTAKGPVASPKILGNISFKEAGLNVAQLNSYFRLKNETIGFVDNGIRFNNFVLLDSLNQPLSLNGMIKTTDYKNFGFALKLRANNFRALNSTSADNELFYGKVYLNINADIAGDMNKPDVRGTLKINKDTKFFFAIPDNDPGVVNQEGIVEFVDMDAPPNNGRQAINVDSLTRAPLKGINLSMNLLTEKEAEITVVVDPVNGDALLVKGEAALNVTMDPSGKLSITGRYLISDGSYNLSIGGLAKRKFTLQQGSYIQWTGAPTEANIDITAIYNINTSPIDLVADQIQTFDQSRQTTYKQKLPFIVYLKMTDQLLKPKINFEITMPENEKNALEGIVYTRLQQVNTNESELNKQVFALLALNRFISDNPFQSLAGGVTAETLARQSVSRLLTQQLNNLASDLIKGVDISFDLNSSEDYTSGTEQTRTDLTVAVSKKLLNDRLTITVGNDFNLEGAKGSTQQGTSIAGNVNIEYALSRDGRYRLRAYRRNQNEGIIEGQIIETGLGFALVVDYNQFKEIFDSFKKRERREERQSRREKAISNEK